MEISFAIFNSVILIANLIILGLNLKLYTEYFKDKSMSQRTPLKKEG